MVTAFAGWLVFKERLPALWWLGAAGLVVGNVIIGRREEGEVVGAAAEAGKRKDGEGVQRQGQGQEGYSDGGAAGGDIGGRGRYRDLDDVIANDGAKEEEIKTAQDKGVDSIELRGSAGRGNGGSVNHPGGSPV